MTHKELPPIFSKDAKKDQARTSSPLEHYLQQAHQHKDDQKNLDRVNSYIQEHPKEVLTLIRKWIKNDSPQ